MSSLLVLILVLNCETPACLPLEQPHEGPVAGDSRQALLDCGRMSKVSVESHTWSPLTMSLGSQTQGLVPAPEERGRNLEDAVWVLLHPPCPLLDSDPPALFLHSAVAGVNSSGEGRDFIHPTLTYLVSRIQHRISVLEYLCPLCWCHTQTAYKIPVLPKSESHNGGITYIISF